MDVGTDCRYDTYIRYVVLLALLWSLKQARCLYIIIVVSAACLLAGCLLDEGAIKSTSRQAITPARYNEGTPATHRNAATGERGYRNIALSQAY